VRTTPTATPTPRVCVGDCDGGGTVSVDELIRGVTIALGLQPVSVCRVFDRNGDDQVTIDELIRAVGNALRGCAVLD